MKAHSPDWLSETSNDRPWPIVPLEAGTRKDWRRLTHCSCELRLFAETDAESPMLWIASDRYKR